VQAESIEEECHSKRQKPDNNSIYSTNEKRFENMPSWHLFAQFDKIISASGNEAVAD
jgi:hypothetical protein